MFTLLSMSLYLPGAILGPCLLKNTGQNDKTGLERLLPSC